MQLSTAGGAVPADKVGYALPYPVTDRASALRLAVEVEERTGAFWRAAVAATTGPDRDRALAALIDHAVRRPAGDAPRGSTRGPWRFPRRTG